MRLLCLFAVLCVCACADTAAGPPDVSQPVEFVLPTAGTGGFGFAHGSCFVGAAAPNGLVKVSPDTRGPYGTITFLHYSGYWFGDTHVQGFSHLHLHGTGATDYGVLSLMPVWPSDKPVPLTAVAAELPLDKASEQARPGTYAVTLKAPEGDIRAQLTATTR